MAAGHVELRTRAAVQILTGQAGVGAQLVFVADDGGEASPLSPGSTAYRCSGCDTLVVPGADEGLDCFECGASIPASAAACPSCGWTW